MGAVLFWLYPEYPFVETVRLFDHLRPFELPGLAVRGILIQLGAVGDERRLVLFLALSRVATYTVSLLCVTLFVDGVALAVRRNKSRWLRNVALWWLVFMLVGAFARIGVFLLPLSQGWVNDFCGQNTLQASGTMAIAFVLLRCPVGLWIATATILEFRGRWIVLVATLLPVLLEFAWSVPILPEWHPLGAYQWFVLGGLLLTPLAAGFVTSLFATMNIARRPGTVASRV